MNIFVIDISFKSLLNIFSLFPKSLLNSINFCYVFSLISLTPLYLKPLDPCMSMSMFLSCHFVIVIVSDYVLPKKSHKCRMSKKFNIEKKTIGKKHENSLKSLRKFYRFVKEKNELKLTLQSSEHK